MRCEICEQPLAAGAKDGACLSCLAAGAAWAHRHVVRLWNRGLDRSAIGAELGYAPATVTTLVLRLRARGVDVVERGARLPRSIAPVAT